MKDNKCPIICYLLIDQDIACNKSAGMLFQYIAYYSHAFTPPFEPIWTYIETQAPHPALINAKTFAKP